MLTSLYRSLLRFSAFALCALAVVSCEDTLEENSTQRDTIVSFLTSSHSPVLISEADIASSLSVDPPFYSTFGQYAYRYIADFYSSDRALEAEVVRGSSITITFRVYGFSGSYIDSSTLPLYTNDSTYEESYVAAGLNTSLWDFTPLSLTIGQSDLLESIQRGLTGCRDGDYVEIYMTMDASYGGDLIGLIPDGESLLFICTIDSVN